MNIWMVARYNPASGLRCTAHLTEAAALSYVRYHYCIPAEVADENLLAWVAANTNDTILIDYDDAAQEPR
ncbi:MULTISPECIES: hypothetical protein [Mycolicibacter]|uniref:Uncharacterized protein n=2 Tax=Mycolicibacter TaxID=1073531 RepID=A0ABU5XMB2_9MYCO|nr:MULTISPECIES: hypothetical protein [unclassified Mycolicibacter]MEB3023410.1 hypothetical protein [Mycolicibacter sp. MYC098]MEB3033752.1 hypothetical protein [Mycolicibacter sp. MYC340]